MRLVGELSVDADEVGVEEGDASVSQRHELEGYRGLALITHGGHGLGEADQRPALAFAEPDSALVGIVPRVAGLRDARHAHQLLEVLDRPAVDLR